MGSDSNTAPDTEDNQQAFPQPSNQKPGLGFPIVRLVALISLSIGTVLEYAIGPYQGKGTGETSLFGTLLASLSQGRLLLADRYYCTYAIVVLLAHQGVPVVFRNHANRNKADSRRGKKMGAKDPLIEWRKPAKAPGWLAEQDYAQLPEVFTLRESLPSTGSSTSPLCSRLRTITNRSWPRCTGSVGR